jgi:hypothetical protein
MKRWMASSILGVAVAVGFAAGSLHGGHVHAPIDMPATWGQAEIATFRVSSDRLIDQMAGRTVSPGETIWHEGLPFRKSTADDIATGQRCKWCPQRRACHD